MDCQELSQEGNTLHVKFKYTHLIDTKTLKLKSSKYICGALYTEFEFTSSRCMTHNNTNYADYNLIVSVRFQKLLDDDDFIYTCKLLKSEQDLLVSEIKVCDDHWHQIAFVNEINCSSNGSRCIIFGVSLNCKILEGQGTIFTSIYDDTKFADFKLCGDGGSFPVHKTVLAVHSPVLQAMFAGEWKESQEGSVALPGVSLETMKHLKDYMYLNKLPETGLQELCALASYYMIQRLVVQCCAKLLNNLTIDNAIELVEFASKYRLRPLLIAILMTMKEEKLKIDKLASKANWPVIRNRNNTTEYVDENDLEEH